MLHSRFCFSGLSRKTPAVQLFICSSQKSGCCPVSMDIHGWKSSLSWAPAAILPWFKANAFYSAGGLWLLFLVSLQLLWKSSTMVAEGGQEREQLQLLCEEQTLEGALKCHVLPCCSSPLLSDGTQPWKQGFCFNTCLQSVALCLPSVFSPLGPKLKDSYEKMKVWASPCPQFQPALGIRTREEKVHAEGFHWATTRALASGRGCEHSCPWHRARKEERTTNILVPLWQEIY